MYGGHLRHPVTPISDAAFVIKRGKKRGSYACGKCGLPKKGHTCRPTGNDKNFSLASTPAAASSSSVEESMVLMSPVPVVRPPHPSRLRRALWYDDDSVADSVEDVTDEIDSDMDAFLCGSGKVPANCLWEVLRRLRPAELLTAARVCKGWNDVTKRIWRAAEEIRLRVPSNAQIGYVGSMLQKCPGILQLSLRMESDVDATMLACIAFSCPYLQSLDILTSDASANRITGDELSRFIAEKRCLTSLKMEGCCNLGGFSFSSTSLSTIWLSDLQSVSKMVFNCPNLKEISLGFSRQENDRTDLTAIVDGLGRSCPKLQNIHIASFRLTHSAVLALTAANLRGLRMLSLVLGSEISDASVAAIASSYSNLELLDLSGSSITDSGIGMICHVFAKTLSKLLLALCPNITLSGIQFAAAELPHLELMDCGMTICDHNPEILTGEEENDPDLHKTPNSKLNLVCQKLIIKHSRLKRLSLWGCSGLDALYLNCAELNDLNLNSCTNLHPERMLLECPNLESVHALSCQDKLVKNIQNQVWNNSSALENHFPSRRLPDGSKRVRVPPLFSPQPCLVEKKWKRPNKRQCAVIAST